MHQVSREFPNRDILNSEGGEIVVGLWWVTRDSRGELEELRLFGPVDEEGPSESGLDREGSNQALVLEWYQSLKSCLYILGERRKGEKESTLIHTTSVKWYQSRISSVYCR